VTGSPARGAEAEAGGAAAEDEVLMDNRFYKSARPRCPTQARARRRRGRRGRSRPTFHGSALAAFAAPHRPAQPDHHATKRYMRGRGGAAAVRCKHSGRRRQESRLMSP